MIYTQEPLAFTQKISVVILGKDEEHAQYLKQLFQEVVPELKITGLFSDLYTGARAINNEIPDLVFAANQVGDKSVFELYELVPNHRIDVVIVSETIDFAYEAMQRECLHYLLEPISHAEMKAVVARKRRQMRDSKTCRLQMHQQENFGYPEHRIAISSANGYDIVAVKDIVLAKAEGNYTNIYTASQVFVCSKTLRDFEECLPKHIFFRTHKTFLINLNKLVRFNKLENEIILEGGLRAELAVRRREEFVSILRGERSATVDVALS